MGIPRWLWVVVLIVIVLVVLAYCGHVHVALSV
jgi:hypothetical protein